MQSLGELKVVEGMENGAEFADMGNPDEHGNPSRVHTAVIVWVNGISAKPLLESGRFLVLIPNEPLTSVDAFQAGYNVWAHADPRTLERPDKFARLYDVGGTSH